MKLNDRFGTKNHQMYNAQKCEKKKYKRDDTKRGKRAKQIVQTHTMWIMIAHHSMLYYSFISYLFLGGRMQNGNAKGKRKGTKFWDVKRHNTMLHIHSIGSDTLYWYWLSITEWNVICKNCTGDSFGTTAALVKRVAHTWKKSNNNNKIEELKTTRKYKRTHTLNGHSEYKQIYLFRLSFDTTCWDDDSHTNTHIHTHTQAYAGTHEEKIFLHWRRKKRTWTLFR